MMIDYLHAQDRLSWYLIPVSIISPVYQITVIQVQSTASTYSMFFYLTYQEGDDEIDVDADDEYTYSVAREYNWTIKSKTERGESSQDILMLMKPQAVTYGILETKCVTYILFLLNLYYYNTQLSIVCGYCIQ